MADLTGLGDLVLTVGGDISPLEDALNGIPAVAQKASDSITAAVSGATGVTDDLTTSTKSLGDAWSNLGPKASGAAGGVNELKDALTAARAELSQTSQGVTLGIASANDLATAEAGVATALQNLHPEWTAAKTDLGDVNGSLTTMLGQVLPLVTALAGLKILSDIATDALEAYGALQKATISLTALTGSAQTATGIIENLKGIAIADALSFPNLVTAAQRMTALGFSAGEMYKTLQTAADTAAATGKSFDSVTNAIDRMVLSGTAQGRMLATLGLSTDALGKSMGVAATDVSAAFKALDQSERLQVINDALAKFGGVAAQVAQGILGQWQNLKTEWQFDLEAMGSAMAPLVSQLLSELSPALEAVVNGFGHLFSALGPLVGGILSSLGQSLADIATVLGATVSGIGSLVDALMLHFNPTVQGAGFTWHGLIEDLNLTDPIRLASTEIQLMSGNMQMWHKDAQLMRSRLDEVTASLKSFIDTSTSKSGLLGIRNDLDAQNKALADAETHLGLVKKAYDEGMASSGQYAAAAKAVEQAQVALNPAFITAKDATREFNTATKDLGASQSVLDGLLKLITPSVTDLATAQNNLKQAQNNAEAAAGALATAQMNQNAALALGPGAVNAQKTATDGLKAAEVAAKQAKDELVAATNAVATAQKAAQQATKDQATTDSDYATMLRTLGKDALDGYGLGVTNLTAAKKVYEAAVGTEIGIQANLNQMEADGQTGTVAYKQAQNDLNDAHVKVTASLKDLNAAQTDNNSVAKDLAAGTAALTAADQALDQLYAQTLTPDSQNFTQALQDLRDAKNDVKDAASDLTDKENAYKDTVTDLLLGTASLPNLKQATDDLKTAKLNLTSQEKDLKIAVDNLTSSFGVSKGTIKDITSDMNDTRTAADNVRAAFDTLKIKSSQSLDELSTKAHDAFVTIQTSGVSSSNQVRDAWIADLEAQRQAMISHGTDLSSAQLTTLTNLLNQQHDFNVSHELQWTTLYNTIESDTTALSDTLLTDLFTGKKSFGQDALNQLEKIAAAFTETLIKPVTDAIGKFIAGALTNLGGSLSGLTSQVGKLADAFTSLFKSAPSFTPQGTGNIGDPTGGAGSGASGAGGASAGGLSGWISAIGSAITAISSVIGNFQMAHLNSTMNAMEQETARMAIYLGDHGVDSILGQSYLIQSAVTFGPLVKAAQSIDSAFAYFSKFALGNLGDINSNTGWMLKKLNEIDAKTGTSTGGSAADSAWRSWVQGALQNINNGIVAIAQSIPWFQTALQNINNGVVACAGWLQGILGVLQNATLKTSGSGGSVPVTGLSDLASYIGANFSNLETWLFNALGKTMALPALPAMPTLPSSLKGATTGGAPAAGVSPGAAVAAGPTVNINVTGNTISGQDAADALAATIVVRMRRSGFNI